MEYLTNAARSLVYSTGLPPASVAAAEAALAVLQQDTRLARAPLARARLFTQTLALPEAQSAIVPLVLGESGQALTAAALLAEHGYYVAAIRPPAVPPGSARLRFAFSALHTEEEVLKLAELIKTNGCMVRSV
jgi:8-amino-7-oxononanoate synthase